MTLIPLGKEVTFDLRHDNGDLYAKVYAGPQTQRNIGSDSDGQVTETWTNLCVDFTPGNAFSSTCPWMNMYASGELFARMKPENNECPRKAYHYGNYPVGYTSDAVLLSVTFTKEHIVQSIPKKCCCGAEATYGVDCGVHADWCDKVV